MKKYLVKNRSDDPVAVFEKRRDAIAFVSIVADNYSIVLIDYYSSESPLNRVKLNVEVMTETPPEDMAQALRDFLNDAAYDWELKNVEVSVNND